KAEAEPAVVIGRNGALEALEDARLMLGLDPDAVVGHRHERAGRILPDLYLDGAPPSELDGIREQVRQNLREAALVPVADRVRVAPHLGGASGLREVDLESAQYVAHEIAEIEELTPELDAARVDPRYVEQVVDELAHAHALFLREAEEP